MNPGPLPLSLSTPISLLRGAIASLILLVASQTSSQAEWTEVSYSLRPGWNSVFLSVQPDPKRISEAFTGIPIKSVWRSNNEFSAVKYIENPEDLIPENPDWLSYIPGRPEVLTNLFTLTAGKAYLIELDGETSVTWTVRGKPVTRPHEWRMDSFNLVGFHVHTVSPPSFSQLLAGSPTHAGQPVYRLAANGEWTEITDLNATPVRSSEAYWIHSTTTSEHMGQVSVRFDQNHEINFGATLLEQRVRFTNHHSAATTISLSPNDSVAEPPGKESTTLGPVALSYWDQDIPAQHYGWYHSRAR